MAAALTSWSRGPRSVFGAAFGVAAMTGDATSADSARAEPSAGELRMAEAAVTAEAGIEPDN